MAAAPDALTRHLPAIESALQDALSDSPPDLDGPAHYVLGWTDTEGNPASAGGKRIRPALCLFAAGLFTDDPLVALPGAVAVELVHNFSLVHDEVQDRDAERHHRPTAWALHGEGQAINLGDFLFVRALRALAGADRVPDGRRDDALGILMGAIERMIAGQWQDIRFETRTGVTPDEYLAMVSGKTGALLGAPLAMGASLAGAGPAAVAALGRWGEAAGLAFQVRDDYLGIWGKPDQTGKSNVNDIARKKKSLPIIHGLSGPTGDAIAAIYARAELGADDIAAVVALLDEAGSAAFTMERAADCARVADELLAAIDLQPAARAELAAVGQYLINRDA